MHFIWKLTPVTAEIFKTSCGLPTEFPDWDKVCKSVIIQCFLVWGFDSKNTFVFLAKIGTCTETAKFCFQNKQLSSKSAEMSLNNAVLTGLSPHFAPLSFTGIGANITYMPVFSSVLSFWKQVFLKLGFI